VHWHHGAFVKIDLQPCCISELIKELFEFQHILLGGTEDD
jgi:hypothetical protein